MKQTLAIFLFCCSSFLLNAQQELIPFLGNGLYGLSKLDGSIVIQPKYDEIKFEGKSGLIAIKKNNLWGFLSIKGETLVKPKLKGYHISSPYSLASRTYENVTKPNLLKIVDKISKDIYYINPLKKANNYRTFVEVENARRGRPYMSVQNYPEDGFFKVATPDLKINFVDTTGQIIFPNGVYDGVIINKNFISVDNGDGKYGLYDSKGNRIIDHQYSGFRHTINESYVLAEEKIKSKHGYTKWLTLYNGKGKKSFSKKTNIKFINQNTLIVTDVEMSGLFQLNGNKIFSFDKTSISLIDYKKTDRFRIQTTKTKYGISDETGNILLDTIYDKIDVAMNDRYVVKSNNKSSLLNYDLSEVFSLDGIDIFKDVRYSQGYFKIAKTENYINKYGLADSTGKITIEPEYDRVLFNGCDFVSLQKDTMKSLWSVKGKMVFPFTMDKIAVNCEKSIISIVSKGYLRDYDFEGNLIRERNLIAYRGNPTNQSPPTIFDKNGNEINKSNYRQIFSNRNIQENQLIYFGRKKDKKDFFNHIFNEKGIEISPDKYGLPEQYTNSKTGQNGAIIVTHKADVINRKEPFRTGAINFEGQWIIQPDYQITRTLGNELLVTGDFKTKKTTIHNRFGKVISTKNYDHLETDSNDKIHNDRIVVGYLTNKDAYLKSLGIIKKDDDYKEIAKKLKDIISPEFLKGYINSRGEEIIPPKYLEAEPFKYQYTTVTGVNKNGKLYSSIIDLYGNTLLETDYESLKILYSDTTLLEAKKDNLVGIIDLNSNIILEPTYETLRTTRFPMTYIVSDSIHSFLLGKNNTPTKLGKKENRTELKSIGDNYFYVKASNFSSGKMIFTFYIFDLEGNPKGKYQVQHLGKSFFSKKLPEGFVSIIKNRNDKPYILNIETGKEYKQ